MGAEPSSPVTADRIRRHLIGVFPRAAFLAALQLELFTAVGDEARTTEEIAAALDLDPVRLDPLLNVLSLDGFLHRDGERYRNAADAAHFLVKGKPHYIGSIHELYADLFRAVLMTAQSLRARQPAAKHDFRSMSDEEIGAFFRGLHAGGVLQGRELAERHRFMRFERLLDVGGGSANTAIGACQACPSLRATVVELDRIAPVAERFIAEAALGDRIEVARVDICAAPPPGLHDVAVLRNLIQVLPRDQARHAIANAARGLRRGGEIYILGYALDEERREPWEAAVFDIAFLNVYEAGQSYRDSEYRAWLADAGCTDIRSERLGTGTTLFVASKS